MKCYYYLLGWLILIPALTFGQTIDTSTVAEILVGSPEKVAEDLITINGRVVQAATGDPVSGATVRLEGFSNDKRSDEFGRFRVYLPPGRYIFLLSHPDMVARRQPVAIYRTCNLDLPLDFPTKEMGEVLLEAYAEDSRISETSAGLERMQVSDIEVQPAFLGEVDVIKSLQWLPGVSSVGEGAAGFNVRGGRADQNLVLFEGAPLYNPTHLLGFFTAIQPEVVESFSLYKGYVPASYGGRAASVLDIQAQYGNRDSLRLRAGLGIVSTRVALEGPIGAGGTTFLVGSRSSYSNWVLRRVEDPAVRSSDAGFQDAFAGLRLPVSDWHQLEVFAYGSRDRFLYSNQFGFEYQTGVAGLHWYILGRSNWSAQISAHAGSYQSDFIDPSGFDATRARTGMRYLHGRQQLLFTPDQHTIRLGLEQTANYMIEPGLEPEGAQSAVLPRQVEGDQGLEMAAFIEDEWEISPKWAVSAGLRYVMYRQLGPSTVYQYLPDQPRERAFVQDSIHYGRGQSPVQYQGLAPRVSLRFRWNENGALKASYGRLFQFVHLISNTMAPTPVDVWQTANVHLAPQRADQWSLGWYQNLAAHRWETSVEAFYKDQANLIEYRDFAELLVNDQIETELVPAIGRAYGVEVTLRKKRGQLTCWLGYTYARSFLQTTSEFAVNQVNQNAWYPAPFDQPHQFDAVMNLKVGRGSSIGMNVTYRQGRPFTALESSFEVNGTVVPLFSNRNQYRIPDYLRFDLSVALGSIVKRWDDQLVFSVYNLLGRENAYSIFYQRLDNQFIPRAFRLAVLGAAFPAITYNVDL